MHGKWILIVKVCSYIFTDIMSIVLCTLYACICAYVFSHINNIFSALAALKKCYSVMIDKLPSNHFNTLLRLQDLAVLPVKIVDSIVNSSSAQIGNKKIVDFLIGLVHTEEHIIIFCALAERMLREFDNCKCILNLRNSKISIFVCVPIVLYA